MRSARSLGVLLFTLSLPRCGGEPVGSEPGADPEAPGGTSSLEGVSFFDEPWPSDLRRDPDGKVRLSGYPNPRGSALLESYIAGMDGVLDGFSPAAAGYVRLRASIDPETLPADPGASLGAGASVQLLDVDPASPERGRRKLVSLHYRDAPGVYWPSRTLAFMPTLGHPLRPRTRYALVVTDAVRLASGEPASADAALEERLGIRPPSPAQRDAARALAPALEEIEKAGIARARIAQLTVFTTGDPTGELFAARDVLRAEAAPPEVRPESWKLLESDLAHDEYEGVYGPSPNFQAGEPPYGNSGGGFVIEGGRPKILGEFFARFSLTVPKAPACPVPASGYPVALYAHGTGGDYRSYVRDGTAGALAEACIASMGVDQIFHGTRPGAPDKPEQSALAFFNLSNVDAARTNARQSALDEVQRARLFTESRLSIPLLGTTLPGPLRFDPDKVLYFGHSQGGLNGPLFAAADDAIRGAVFSGASSVFSITLLEKTEPAPNVAELVRSIFLHLAPEEYEELSVFHPAISLAQTIVDPVDPIHYARHLAGEPREGFAPKSALVTVGVNPDGSGDSYAPPRGIEAHGLAMGLPLALPAQRPIPEAAYLGPEPVEIPPEGLSGNLAGGLASGALVQWPVPPGSDGHFVVFRVPEARRQATSFLENLAREPAGRVPRP